VLALAHVGERVVVVRDARALADERRVDVGYVRQPPPRRVREEVGRRIRLAAPRRVMLMPEVLLTRILS